MATIDSNTLRALFIESQFQDQILGTGTGFIIKHKGTYYLVTNWHVITGKNPVSGQPINKRTAATPDSLIIWHHLKDRLLDCKKRGISRYRWSKVD